VLVEIGGQRVLRGNIIFSEMLRPGKEIVLKLQRGNELLTLTPTVEPLPQGSTRTSCSFVDLAVDYIVAPTPAQAPRMVRVETGAQGEGKYVYTYEPARVKGTMMARARRDSAGEESGAPVAAAGGVNAGPMVSFFGGGSNVLAGVQLMALSAESSRLLGVKHGILVNSVLPGTPGRESGLRGGDILLTADGVDLRSVLQLQRIIRGSGDQVVTLVLMRDKKRETVQLRW
jgi:membrane-associated protease RseP (regulator of RpoE activity)